MHRREREKNDEAGLSYLWLQREERGRGWMPGEPTGMKTSRMPNLELVHSPIPDGGAVAQEAHSRSSLVYMRPKQWICTSFCLGAMGYSNLPGNYPIMILATDAIYRLCCQKLMEVYLFAPICMNSV